MTTLDPALDKLRNKELSFGCIIKSKGDIDRVCTGQSAGYGFDLYQEYAIPPLREMQKIGHIDGYSDNQQNYSDEYNILGHPLTLGRIWKLGYDKFTVVGGNIINTMQCIMNDVYTMGLADQTEIERMQNEEARGKLKPLLVEFSKYL